jgi:acyl transferase domain-containing protein
MGAGLDQAYPVFRRAFDDCAAALDLPLREIIADPRALEQTGYAQPALFALEVALFRLLADWGIRPDYVLGHSIGELAAAHVAGVWSLEDAAVLVTARARLMQALPAGGAMYAVAAGVDEITLAGRVSVAAVNGPAATVVSGDQDVLAELVEGWRRTGHRVKRLAVSHAFHSARMDPILADYAEVADSIRYHAPTIPLVSTVSGRPTDVRSAAYWVRQMRETVRFADGIAALRDAGVDTFLELGPAGALSAAGRDCAPDAEFVPVLRADRSEPEALLAAVAHAQVRGVRPDWTAFFAGSNARRVDLPTYAFQRERFWLAASEEAVDPKEWRYTFDWIPTTAVQPTGSWLVVLPDGLAAPEFAADTVTLRVTTDDRARIAAMIPDRPFDGILSLLALDDDGPTRTAALVQALGDAGSTAPLWCVTTGAVSTGPADPVVNPIQATVWGLGRVAALEHPDRWGGLVDLPTYPAPVLLPVDEDQVAVRDGMYARRLRRANRGAADREWRPRGTVLVTGGIGALGGHVARWLAARGAEHLVLASRAGGTFESGVDIPVTVAACDVTDRAALAELLVSLPDLTAVVHAAGVLDDGVLDALDPERFDRVLRPKVVGGWNLHDLTADRDLDAFVLFSSAAGSVGGAGQAN